MRWCLRQQLHLDHTWLNYVPFDIGAYKQQEKKKSRYTLLPLCGRRFLPEGVAAVGSARQERALLLSQGDLVASHCCQLSSIRGHSGRRGRQHLLGQPIKSGTTIVPILYAERKQMLKCTPCSSKQSLQGWVSGKVQLTGIMTVGRSCMGCIG